PRECANHQRHSDRFTNGAAVAKNHCGCDSATRVRKDDSPDHFPARRTKAERPLLQLSRYGEKELARHARNDRQAPDREEDDRGEDIGAVASRWAEEGDETESRVESRIDVVT